MRTCEHGTYASARLEDDGGAISAVRAAAARMVRNAGRRLVERKAATALLKMDDDLLRDIGLTREDALQIARHGRVTADRIAGRQRAERTVAGRARPC
jgi:uncharacterized protein YjiS (DUF1127 family)